MANIQIGKYNRPGIFIEEFDQSVTSSAIVEGINSLVVGVSKKGPVNTPIRLTTITELEAVFGQLDRNLERKGSFFHRTISKMLETAPVYAINLLSTDDNLDVIEYKSLSTAADYLNDIKRNGSYRRIFDTTGFWKKDTESFINLTKNNSGYTDRSINITNLSDRPISVFIFKSSLKGFDRTLLEWYGSVEKMPTYVNTSDYASDYLVDVVVVGGDWSNYQELAVDSRWSSYFNSSGLIKEQIRNFANDRNITLLSYYEGLSLIPYFRDLNGRNIFIETVINRDTETTGLFCAVNTDLIEKDFYNGKLDLIGNTIVDKNEKNIEFLSYKELISEEITMSVVPLDLPGNVTSLLGTSSLSYQWQSNHVFGDIPLTDGVLENISRTAWFSEGSIYGVSGGSTSLTYSTSTIDFKYIVQENSFAIIGDQKIDLISKTASFRLNVEDYPLTSATESYTAVTVLGEDGEINVIATYTSSKNPEVSPTDIVLGYINFNISYPGEFKNIVYTDLTIDDNGFIDMNSDDYRITRSGNIVKVTFLGTNVKQNTSNYRLYRRFKMFNRLVNLIDNINKNKMCLLLEGGEKYSFENITISNIITSVTENKSFELKTGLTNKLDFLVNNNYLVIYTIDNEFIIGSKGCVTKNLMPDAEEGVVSKYSTFYSRYYDGIINTKDFFYTNILSATESVNMILINGEEIDSTNPNLVGNNYMILSSNISFLYGQQILIPKSYENSGTLTIVGNTDTSGLADDLGYNGFYAYKINENVIKEELIDVTVIYDYNNKVYLKMYLDNNGLLDVEFRDELLISYEPIELSNNNKIYIQSAKSNLKQTIEIEVPSGYTQIPNKILVDGTRYTEVKVGDFLEAYVDESTLETGEYGRKLTRILSKKQYLGDSKLTEITCDSRIKTKMFGDGDLQTTRYVSVDNYATTYKAITLKGFKIRNSSLPDGTEEKQNSILNLVAKGTPLFKALTNKEAIDFRYVIDSFGLGLSERSKQQLVDICGERLDTFGFINMPSIRQFKNSASPIFVNNEGVLKVEYISLGGDPESNPAFLYSFGDGAGTTCVGYFTPYVKVNDNGRSIEVPPSSYVATTYIRKHVSNVTSITPWTISAGITNGKVSNISGLEMDYTPSDIGYLNQAQMNPIVFKRNRGYVIETENTAQTLYKSALSYIHVREVLIELERDLSAMLLDYQWRYNTPDVRAEIKLRADVICETFVNKNGLYNYFNKMDEENNSSEIIDNQMGVLDTYVEPIKGMGIIVNNITILRTGAISAGGFINS